MLLQRGRSAPDFTQPRVDQATVGSRARVRFLHHALFQPIEVETALRKQPSAVHPRSGFKTSGAIRDV
jgi:hypothetical protein